MTQQGARWLLRPRGWILSLQSTASSLASSSGSFSSTACGASACAGLLRRAAVVPCYGLGQRAYGVSPSLEMQSPSLDQSTSGTRSLALPAWLRNLLPGAKHLPGTPVEVSPTALPQASSQAPGITAGAAAGSQGSGDEEDLKALAEMRGMTMQGYVEYCKKMRSGAPPPRPRQPPVPRGHHDYVLFQDMRRISFLRLQQHERISSLITQAEEELILSLKEQVLRNRGLLEAIADRTGIYIDLEVKDCIEQFLATRRNAERIHRYVTEFGKTLPRTAEQQKHAEEFMKGKEAEEELRAALSRRDRAACPLTHKLPWAGSSALCELTGLRYFECCGRQTDGLDAGDPQLGVGGRMKPQSLTSNGQYKKSLLDKDQVRKAYKKFKSSTESRLRTSYLKAKTPSFRDY